MNNIDIQIQALINQGLRENIDFRVVYFNTSAEIKFINK